jgi:hypothetical protein
MTNRELLKTSKEFLNAVDRQRPFVLQVELTALPCPACQKPVDTLAGSGVDIDEYDFGNTKREFRCPHCHAELEVVVPFFAAGPGWHWKLKDSWLQDQLHKAREYDRLNRAADEPDPAPPCG